MMTKYGHMPDDQISEAKLYLRKQIFYLLLYVDPHESVKFHVDVNEAFRHVFYQLMGFNKILREPLELVIVMNFLESALAIYNSEDFDFMQYRKLILDAGAKIMEVKVGD